MMATGGVGMTLPLARGNDNNDDDSIVGDDNFHDNPMHEMIRTNSNSSSNNNNASRRYPLPSPSPQSDENYICGDEDGKETKLWGG